jgi:hypothetical protein
VDKGSDQLAFHHFLFQLVLIWAAMEDFLVFSAIASSSSSSCYNWRRRRSFCD